MAKRIISGRKHHLKFRPKSDFTVPPDNVLDLKKIVAAKEKDKEKQEAVAENRGIVQPAQKK